MLCATVGQLDSVPVENLIKIVFSCMPKMAVNNLQEFPHYVGPDSRVERRVIVDEVGIGSSVVCRN